METEDRHCEQLHQDKQQSLSHQGLLNQSHERRADVISSPQMQTNTKMANAWHHDSTIETSSLCPEPLGPLPREWNMNIIIVDAHYGSSAIFDGNCVPCFFGKAKRCFCILESGLEARSSDESRLQAAETVRWWLCCQKPHPSGPYSADIGHEYG